MHKNQQSHALRPIWKHLHCVPIWDWLTVIQKSGLERFFFSRKVKALFIVWGHFHESRFLFVFLKSIRLPLPLIFQNTTVVSFMRFHILHRVRCAAGPFNLEAHAESLRNFLVLFHCHFSSFISVLAFQNCNYLDIGPSRGIISPYTWFVVLLFLRDQFHSYLLALQSNILFFPSHFFNFQEFFSACFLKASCFIPWSHSP